MEAECTPASLQDSCWPPGWVPGCCLGPKSRNTSMVSLRTSIQAHMGRYLRTIKRSPRSKYPLPTSSHGILLEDLLPWLLIGQMKTLCYSKKFLWLVALPDCDPGWGPGWGGVQRGSPTPGSGSGQGLTQNVHPQDLSSTLYGFNPIVEINTTQILHRKKKNHLKTESP